MTQDAVNDAKAADEAQPEESTPDVQPPAPPTGWDPYAPPPRPVAPTGWDPYAPPSRPVAPTGWDPYAPPPRPVAPTGWDPYAPPPRPVAPTGWDPYAPPPNPVAPTGWDPYTPPPNPVAPTGWDPYTPPPNGGGQRQPARPGVSSESGWSQHRFITHLWSAAESPGAWISVHGAGWKRLSPASESGHSHLTQLALLAKNYRLPVAYHEDSRGEIDQLLV
ncbi:hypothetical protein FHU38_000281 [Saccharomonospora amisosensis]|uniref:Uncharacterized protein n=1 Tax=Saccharomonospora amisosensis TaxID=1128677 RepID=A0A7X5ULK5_9PSEU|nr:hypothetical protein [Saccharomonospora amisosensis]NIJ09937.1 hypothetical protein [Saccharomonospora amisosensis]